MNDFERKLRQTPFRTPPPALRGEILAAATPSWQAWLWPAPRVWAALAAVWLGLLLVDHFTASPTPSAGVAAASAPLQFPPPDSLLAMRARGLDDFIQTLP